MKLFNPDHITRLIGVTGIVFSQIPAELGIHDEDKRNHREAVYIHPNLEPTKISVTCPEDYQAEIEFPPVDNPNFSDQAKSGSVDEIELARVRVGCYGPRSYRRIVAIFGPQAGEVEYHLYPDGVESETMRGRESFKRV